jgi:hypothetical protein
MQLQLLLHLLRSPQSAQASLHSIQRMLLRQ